METSKYMQLSLWTATLKHSETPTTHNTSPPLFLKKKGPRWRQQAHSSKLQLYQQSAESDKKNALLWECSRPLKDLHRRHSAQTIIKCSAGQCAETVVLRPVERNGAEWWSPRNRWWPGSGDGSNNYCPAQFGKTFLCREEEEEEEGLQKIEEHPFASKIRTVEELCAKSAAEEIS